RLVERTQDLVTLELADRTDAARRRGARRRHDALDDVVRQVLGPDDPGTAQHHRTLDHVAQLPYVARPRIAIERPLRLRREAADLTVVLPIELLHERAGE